MKQFKLAIVASLSFLLMGSVLTPAAKAQDSDSLDFLGGLPDFGRVHQMLPDYLNKMDEALLDQRRQKIAQLSSADDIKKRQAYVRETMLRILGGLPERTPLNARVLGVVDRDGYKIEKVIFESQPHFYVPGNLYLPKSGHPPYPGVLFPLGHEARGKSNPTWQQMLVTLARRGYVAFAWDPLGQGERSQFYDADLEHSKIGEHRSTVEHTMLGAQCLLVGDALARYTIWDGIRALDYLLSRPEVDPARIACTGNSGGGTHTAYLSTLDDRIKVALPSCYITSWRRLLESIGPQDEEQCLPPWLEMGLDQADFVEAFAPKPYRMLSAIRDFFSISGARESYAESKRIYGLMNAQDKLSMFEADDHHGYTHPRRQAAYAWLGLWLKGKEDLEPETEVPPESFETLRCADTGQVATSLGGETVFSLNQRRAEQKEHSRPPQASRNQVREPMRQLIGFQPPAGLLVVKPFGRVERQGYRIERLIYETEPGIMVPAVLFLPETGGAKSPAIVYVSGRGKSAGSGEIEQLARMGFVVLALDTRGMGETAIAVDPDERTDYSMFGDYGDAMRAFLAGKTLVGMRAEDVWRGVDLLAARPEVDADKIYGFGVGAGAVVMLHEAALDERIKKVALEQMLVSYDSVVRHRIHRQFYESLVPGALKAYDLPDLVESLAPRPVWIVDARDPMGEKMGPDEARMQYARATEVFRTLGAESAIHFVAPGPEEKLDAVYQGLR